jgi:hypothetical protein
MILRFNIQEDRIIQFFVVVLVGFHELQSLEKIESLSNIITSFVKATE